MAIDLKRRDFLKIGAGVGLSALVGNVACGPDRANEDVCDLPLPTEAEMAAGAVQKGPYVQYIDRTSVRIRFETRIDQEVPVIVQRGKSTEELIPDRVSDEINFRRGIGKRNNPRQDKAGTHVLHTLTIDNLTPGESISYTVMHAAGEPICGTVVAPPSSNTAFRLGWIADTMYPTNEGSIDCLIAQKPDLVLHGGDLVYDTNPIDSWNELFAQLQPVFRSCAMHFNVGNHEFEAQNEIVVQFDRLLNGQGLGSHIDAHGKDNSVDAHGRPRRYHSFYYGGVQFICLDSESRIPEEEDYETGELIEEKSDGVREVLSEDSEQIQWLDAQLESAKSDPEVRHIVVSFHRPYFTWSKYGTRGETLAMRDILHPRFVDAGVSVVLCGHVHAFEYFEVDGIPYVVDGGGGALGVNPEQTKEEVLETRPEEADYHRFSDASYGITTIDFEEDGGFTIQRFLDSDASTPQYEQYYPSKS